MTDRAYHTPEDFSKIDEGIRNALEGERWLTVKQIRRKMAQARIHATGQCIALRCRILQKDGVVERMDEYNGCMNGRACWRLAR